MKNSQCKTNKWNRSDSLKNTTRLLLLLLTMVFLPVLERLLHLPHRSHSILKDAAILLHHDRHLVRHVEVASFGPITTEMDVMFHHIEKAGVVFCNTIAICRMKHVVFVIHEYLDLVAVQDAIGDILTGISPKKHLVQCCVLFHGVTNDDGLGFIKWILLNLFEFVCF